MSTELDDSDGGAPILDLCDVCDGMGRRRAGQWCTPCNGTGSVPRLRQTDDRLYGENTNLIGRMCLGSGSGG